MNAENTQYNQQAAPPPPDPRIDKLAYELETSWKQYNSVKDAAEKLSQRPNMPEELIRSVKDAASKRLEENVSKSVKNYTNPGGFGMWGSSTHQQQKSTNVKKLCRTEYDKMLAGVCGGIGEYLNLDSSIIRLFFVIASFVYFIGLVAYIVLAILLPLKIAPDTEQ